MVYLIIVLAVLARRRERFLSDQQLRRVGGIAHLPSNLDGLVQCYVAAIPFPTHRFGAGFDVPINDLMAWKVEVSRMGFHIQTPANLASGWTNTTNFSTGIVFTISN